MANPPNPNNHPDKRPDWARLHLWQIQPVRDVLVVFVILGLLWLGQAISVVTVPVLLAILFAYLFEPVIQLLVRRTRLSRKGAVASILVAAIVLVLIPVTLGLSYGVIQTAGLTARLTNNVRLVTSFVQADEAAAIEAARQKLLDHSGQAWIWMGEQLRAEEGGDLEIVFATASAWTQANAQRIAQTAVGLGTNVFQTALQLITGAISLAFMVFLTGFFFYFIATKWIECKGFAVHLLPEIHRARSIDLLKRFDIVVSAFIRGRLTIAFIQSILFTLGFMIIGVPAAFILGPLVAILAIVPYLALIGVPIAITLLWLENHTGIRGNIIWVIAAPLVLYFLVQAADDYVLTPMIQGKETGMSTPMILFASLAGGALFGVFGLLIAIPIAACLKIVIEAILWPRFRDWTKGRKADFLPIDSN
ncbi:MAG: AI-2E family transporter [Phycisphaeraceae bacterium]|nr:AI-2E family transporter [Phycisphaeraceae bacterium]MCW5762590.1 AI-2E family transporter [Phycisphaeraceae bacterium]